MDLNNLLKLAGLAAQTTAAKTEAKDGVPGKANTRPDPKIFPDGPSNLGSVSDTSLRRYLKAKGQPVSVEETTYPNLQIEEMLESYVAYTAEKAKNPYAIGMASAMKSTGDKPPLKKSTINKAHKIAKGIDESSLDEAGARPRWNLEGNQTYMVGGNLNYDDKMEYPLSLEDAAILNKYLDQADDAEKRKIWNLFWDHEEMGHEPEGPELAIQYAKDAMGMNESDEATSGTYARVIYDYSEDFGMITLYNNGNKIDEWSGYFGVGTVGNPLADKFVEIAKKNGLNPEGMNIVDDEGETGTFGNNTFNWDQFAKDETGMNESINESYISDLTRVLKNSGQLLNEAGGIGGGVSGGKFGATAQKSGSSWTDMFNKLTGNGPSNYEDYPSFADITGKPTGPAVNAVRPAAGPIKGMPAAPSNNISTRKLPWSYSDSNGIKGLEKAPWSPGDRGAPGDVAVPKTKPNLPGGARPEGPAAGIPAAPKVVDPNRGGKPQGNTARTTPTPLPVGKPKDYPVPVDTTPGGKPAVGPAYKPGLAGKVQRSTTPMTGGARPAGPAAGMPKAPPQPASFKDAFRAARKAAGGAGGVFMWNGKPYQTNIKGEPAQAWNSKNLKQVGNWSASESADVNGIAVNEAVAKIACTKCDEVSTAAAWNKNHDTCPKCKTSKQGVAEAATNKKKVSEAEGNKFGVFKSGGSIGEKNTGKPVKTFATKEEAVAYAKRMNQQLSKGEKEHYKLNYKAKAISEAAKPDFLDMDKDGNKKEPMKKALKDKEKVSESISYLKRLAGL
jgi:hypothetical protein